VADVAADVAEVEAEVADVAAEEAAVVALAVRVATDTKVELEVSASVMNPISRTMPEPVNPITDE
jgi:hypothetical protein